MPFPPGTWHDMCIQIGYDAPDHKTLVDGDLLSWISNAGWRAFDRKWLARPTRTSDADCISLRMPAPDHAPLVAPDRRCAFGTAQTGRRGPLRGLPWKRRASTRPALERELEACGGPRGEHQDVDRGQRGPPTAGSPGRFPESRTGLETPAGYREATRGRPAGCAPGTPRSRLLQPFVILFVRALGGFPANAVLFHAVDERFAADVQVLGGVRLVAVVLVEGPHEQFLFD